MLTITRFTFNEVSESVVICGMIQIRALEQTMRSGRVVPCFSSTPTVPAVRLGRDIRRSSALPKANYHRRRTTKVRTLPTQKLRPSVLIGFSVRVLHTVIIRSTAANLHTVTCLKLYHHRKPRLIPQHRRLFHNRSD